MSHLAETLADFTSQTTFDTIPAASRERVKYFILDGIGVALAATRHDFARSVYSGLSTLAAGDAEVIGMPARLQMRDAVMMNGTLIHGLDYDDTYMPGNMHFTSFSLPCALGVAAWRHMSGRDMLTACTLAMEISARLGAVAQGALIALGFQPSGTLGAFACALAAGKLLGLNREQLINAQGIALSMAAGSMQFAQDQRGPGTKRIQPGWAAVSGITAATLAQAGFLGPYEAYEGTFGFFPLYMGARVEACDYTLATRDLGTVWEVDRNAIKPYPACHFSHAFADAAHIIREKYALQADDVVRIVARVPEKIVGIVCEPLANKRRPDSSHGASFSLPYAIASAFVRGRYGLSEMEADAYRDAGVLALAAKVEYEIAPEWRIHASNPGEVTVHTRAGQAYTHREEINRGAPERPLSAQEITAKYYANALTAITQAQAERILGMVMDLEASKDAKLFAAALAA